MTDLLNLRKIEHINIINEQDVDRKANYFDGIKLTHRALPEINLNDIDPSVTFLGKKISFPLIISSMTGGDNSLLQSINKNLAIAAQATNVAMSVGSQRILIENPETIKSFNVRKYAPTIPLISNLGAVQLNYGFGLEECNKAINSIESDGLFFHLNPLQECIQPEGDTNFSNILEKIIYIKNHINKPLLIKEIGCGINHQDIQKLVNKGIEYVDIAGQGGTSWSAVEFHRDHSGESLGKLFQDWGIPTVLALKNAYPFCQDVNIIASGGLRSGLDMIKSIILGARMCGLAGPLLKSALISPDSVILEIKKLKRAFCIAMFLLGTKNISALHGNLQLLLDKNF